jgi:hypothetical protein
MDHVELNHVEYFQGIMEIAEIEIEVKRQNSIRIIVSHRLGYDRNRNFRPEPDPEPEFRFL